MIVTCPNCTTKFRVRDDSVPEEGAQLKCATCSTVFMAYAPKKADEDIQTIVERLKVGKEAAVERTKSLEAELAPLRMKLGNFEAELQKLRTQNLQLSQEADDLRRGRDAVERRFQDELSRLKAELEQARGQEASAGNLQNQLDGAREESSTLRAKLAEASGLKDEIVRLQGDLLKAKASAALGASEDVRQVQAALEVAQRTTGKLTVDLERTREELEEAKREGGGGGDAGAATERDHYRAEAERLRKQLAMMVDSGRELVDPADLLNAVGPLLWGLDNAIDISGPSLALSRCFKATTANSNFCRASSIVCKSPPKTFPDSAALVMARRLVEKEKEEPLAPLSLSSSVVAPSSAFSSTE